MNTPTRWEPLREMEDLQNRLSSLFGRVPARRQNGGQEAITVAEWAPLVDIIEDDKEYIIKAELPGCFTILGVSNISFGLNPASRVVLNSVFLHDAVEAGLDAAIVNASKIEPLNRIGEQELKVARDLIYDRRQFEGDVCTYDPLTHFTTLFENVKTKSAKKASKGETVEERLKNHIIDGEKIGLEDELKTALETYSALDIINNILLEGMKVVGDLFGSGQMQLPFVLQSAEAMKAAVRFLEPFMEKKGGATAKGRHQ